MIQHAAHHFTLEELQFLNRGPTYVIPGQMHLFSIYQTLETTLTQQLLPLRKQLLHVFTNCSLELARQQIFRRTIEQQFFESFSSSSSSIPIDIRQRAFHEQALLQSIQTKLQQDHLILRRTADNFNTFYLDYTDHFNLLIENYLQTNTCFEMIGTLDPNLVNAEEQYRTRLIEVMDNILEKLHRKKEIHSIYYEKLQLAKKKNLSLPYLYFLPTVHSHYQTLLQPRLSSCRNAPIHTMTKFLDRLLRPLYENSCQSIAFLDGHDFIQKLQVYCQLDANHFTVHTEFVTFQLHNLYTRVSHRDLLTALNDFLIQQLPSNRFQWLSIETIINLVKFSLEHHIFTYENIIYRYKKGSPLNYKFTQLLFDIYIQQWQTKLVLRIRATDQFYGRYHHLGIFTWNTLNEDLHMSIQELNEQNADIQLTITRANKVNFLDAYIENRNGQLYTCVYRDVKQQQPFLLPYSAEHPRKLHRQWFRFRIARAIHYCPSFDDFQEEYLRLELTFLANGYSLDFVKYLWDKCLERFKPLNYVYIHNAVNYKSFRLHVIRYYNQKHANSRREYQLDRLLTQPSTISFFYLYDWGNRIEFNRKFLQLWSDVIMKDPKFSQLALKMSLRCKHCFSLHTLLIHYRQ